MVSRKEDASPGAISVALQHPRFSEDIQTICKMLQVCRSWRTAVQQAHPQGLAVVFSLQQSKEPWLQMPKVASFVAWVPQYASLLRSITLDLPAVQFPRDQELLNFYEAVDQLLAHSLWVASSAAVNSARNSMAVAAGTPQALQLINFKGINLLSPSAVAALPAASLQQLHLLLPASNEWPDKCIFQRPAALSAGLSGLTGLRSLSLLTSRADTRVGSLTCIPPNCIEALSGLQHLTQLSLKVDPTKSSLQLLPPWLQQLQVWLVPGGYVPERTLLIDLQHLTALQHLGIDLYGHHTQAADQLILPTQLQTLDWGESAYEYNCPSSLPQLGEFSFNQLPHLKQLNIYSVETADGDSLQPLQQLGSLPHLQHLSLAYSYNEDAIRTASVWQQLQQLRMLEVQMSYDDTPIDRRTFDDFLQHTAAVSWLTRLSLDMFVNESVDEADVCLHLTGLRALSCLELHITGDPEYHGQAHDAMHLTVLTALTKLDLSGLSSVVDDVAAVALACNLVNLQHLDLSCCGIDTMSLIPAVAKHLTLLTHLDVSDTCKLPYKCLMLLTSIKSLRVVKADCTAKEHWADFWRALGGAPATSC